jgi:hypothetical protein
MSLAHPAFMQARDYALVESMMRTGDLILYNDERLTTKHASLALRISQVLSWLPCNTMPALFDSVEIDDEEAQNVVVDSERREWLHWRCAVVVMMLLDETDTNPLKDPKKTIPFVLSQTPESRVLVVRPLRDFLREISTADHTYVALRQLFTAADSLPAVAMNKSGRAPASQMRDVIARHIFSFYQQVRSQRQAEDVMFSQQAIDSRNAHMTGLMHELVPRAVTMERGSAHKHMNAHDAARSQLALFAASPAYFALFTLFRAGIVRVEPQADLAAIALQEQGCIDKFMHAETSYSDEILLRFNAPMSK